MMNDIDNSKVGKFIAKLRKENKLTQEELAAILLVTDKAVSKWESGKGLPDLEFQRKLCSIFDITLEELHEGKRNPNIKNIIKLNKILKIIILTLIPFLVFFVSYFLINFKTTKIYYVRGFRDDKNELQLNAFFLQRPKDVVLFFDSVEILGYDIQKVDIIDLSIYSKGKVIYYSNTNKPDIKLISLNNINLKDITVKISIYSANNDHHDYESKLILSRFKTKDENIYINKKEKSVASDEEIINNLLQNGFVKINDNVYEKNDKNIKIKFFMDNRVMELSFIQNNYIKKVVIKYELLYYQTIIYDKNDLTNVLEKYDYFYKEDSLKCYIGECTGYEKTNKLVQKYLTLLFVE